MTGLGLVAARAFAKGAAAGLLLFVGFVAGLAAAERNGWPR